MRKLELSSVSKVRHLVDGRAEIRPNLSTPNCKLRSIPLFCSHFNSQHHHLPIFYQARNLEVLLAGLSSPLFTFCHDHILVILPVTSFTNVSFLIHSHIHSPASCPYQCSTRLQEPPYWPSCFLSFPFTVHSLARLLLKF